MQPAIEVQEVSKRFARPLPFLRRAFGRPGPDVVEALNDVTLDVRAGEIFGLVGRNGQGKTTLIKTTCGLIEPTSGRVRVFGHDTVRELREVKRRVGLVSADERSFYYRLTGRANLTFFGRLQGLADRAIAGRIDALSTTFELGPLLDRPFQEYSTGNKQRLAIARALLPNPPLLLLDEPTRSLDPISAESLRRVLSRFAGPGEGKTVLITTHNLSEIEQLCERVAILRRGRVIECDTLAALRAKYGRDEMVALYLGRPPTDAFRAEARAVLGTALREVSRDDGRIALRLERRADDDKLEHLMALAVAHRLRVVGCDTDHFGLMQVLERIEAEAP